MQRYPRTLFSVSCSFFFHRVELEARPDITWLQRMVRRRGTWLALPYVAVTAPDNSFSQLHSRRHARRAYGLSLPSRLLATIIAFSIMSCTHLVVRSGLSSHFAAITFVYSLRVTCHKCQTSSDFAQPGRRSFSSRACDRCSGTVDYHAG